MPNAKKPLLALCADLVDKLGPSTPDALLAHAPGYSRLQIKRALENAAYRDRVVFLSAGPLAGRWVSPATAATLPEAYRHRRAATPATPQEPTDTLSTALRQRTPLELLWMGQIPTRMLHAAQAIGG